MQQEILVRILILLIGLMDEESAYTGNITMELMLIIVSQTSNLTL